MEPKLDRYFNRELSWLAFNQLHLDQASDSRVPLLERLRHLALTGRHLDELFMVRVAGLRWLADAGVQDLDFAGMTPSEQLMAIDKRTRRMVSDQYTCFAKLESSLFRAGIRRFEPGSLSDRQTRVVERVFDDEITSRLTPLALANDEPFPQLANQVVTVCVRLETPSDGDRYVIIPFGPSTHRFLTLYSEGGYAYSLLEDAVAMFADRLFPGESVAECRPFRLTRWAESGIRQDLAGDLLASAPAIETSDREAQRVVRLEIDHRASAEMTRFLVGALQVPADGLYRIEGPLDLAAYTQLFDLAGFDKLKYPAWPPKVPPDVDLTVGLFETLSRRDLLLCHPYDSLEPIIRLVEEAADDPDVVAIKQTLYGTDRDSALVKALKRAAENDKYVTAIIELNPRFGEHRRVEWVSALEQASMQVIYGTHGLKTHARLCIVVRREPGGIRRYVHFGTGDQGESNARFTSDVSLLTCDEMLGADATDFFNSVASHSYAQQFRKMVAAPKSLRERLIEMIEAETRRKQEGQRAFIEAKINALGDREIIDALYAASRAGVPIRLIVSGICCLRPGVPGLSQGIRVVSIVDRFREHARVLRFCHGGDDLLFISSADWMPHNLDRRVEVLVPVQDSVARKRLIRMLEVGFQDTEKASLLQANGKYVRRKPADGATAVRSQEVLYHKVVDAVRQAEQSRRTVFQPHRAPENR
jgi:polyphosphate kinase